MKFCRIMGTMVGALLLSLIAMQFSDRVRWTASDFALVAALLFACGLLLDRVLTKGARYRGVGLPLGQIPDTKLESGRDRPASGLAGAERRADRMLAARLLQVLAVDTIHKDLKRRLEQDAA
jgi:hypothetical protein